MSHIEINAYMQYTEPTRYAPLRLNYTSYGLSGIHGIFGVHAATSGFVYL